MNKRASANKWEFILAFILVIFAVATRFLPHAPNFSPVLAIGLFAGSVFRTRLAAFFIPLSVLFASDAAIGFYPGMAFTYVAYVITIFMGFFVHDRRPLPVAISSVGTAVVFFLVSNFGVWLQGGLYERTWSGLQQCFLLAIPFFQATLVSTVVGSVVLFSIFNMAERLLAQRIASEG